MTDAIGTAGGDDVGPLGTDGRWDEGCGVETQQTTNPDHIGLVRHRRRGWRRGRRPYGGMGHHGGMMTTMDDRVGRMISRGRRRKRKRGHRRPGGGIDGNRRGDGGGDGVSCRGRPNVVIATRRMMMMMMVMLEVMTQSMGTLGLLQLSLLLGLGSSVLEPILQVGEASSNQSGPRKGEKPESIHSRRRGARTGW